VGVKRDVDAAGGQRRIGNRTERGLQEARMCKNRTWMTVSLPHGTATSRLSCAGSPAVSKCISTLCAV